MTRHSLISGLVVLLLLASLVAGGLGPAAAQEPDRPGQNAGEAAPAGFKAGELLVRFKEGAATETAEGVLAQHGASYLRHLYQSEVQLWQVPEGSEQSLSRQLIAEALVVYAEPNYLYRAFDTVPNDTHYSKQWGHTKMHSPAAWDTTTGSTGTKIAIIDSGIDEGHSDLASKIVAGYDFWDYDSNPHDENGHGTHVAGIAAAVTNNSSGVAGMDWLARIMPIRVLNAEGTGYSSDITDGITWAYTHGARVLNMSLGGPTYSQAMQDAITAARTAGSLVVAAMGNDNISTPSYPAAYSNVLAVSATGPADAKASYSNYGSHCDVAAPGGDMGYYHDPAGIYSTMPTYDVYLTTHYSYYKNYDYLNGTSQAAPYVAGLAGLLWAAAPTLTPAQVQTAIQDTADDLGTPGWDQYFGHGRINAQAALQAYATPDAPTLLAISNPDGDGSYLVDWNAAAGATGYRLEEDDNAGFSSPAVRYTGTSTQFSVSGQGPGVWYYRVRASNAAGNGPWSSTQSVGVVPQAPALATISNPGGGDAYLLSWSAVSGASSYTLQEDDNGSFSSPATRYAGTNVTYQVTGQPGGTWYYRVRAAGAAGNSAWSASRSTTVNPRPLAAPTLNAISNPGGDGAYLVDWSDVSGATGYRLEQSRDMYFGDPEQVYQGAASQRNITGQPGGTWYYRARATSASGNGPWSNTRSVVVTSYVYLPLVVNNYGTGGSSVIPNGDFEGGRVNWTEFSTHGWTLIINSGFPGSVTPHGGSWAVWLGGDDDDVSYIQQQVTVPSGSPYLGYWHWIASADTCGYDFGRVIINTTEVSVYNLCSSTSTGGWVKKVVNLSAYSGQSVSLKLQADTDSSLNSNLFIDDVQFQSTPAGATGLPVDNLGADAPKSQ